MTGPASTALSESLPLHGFAARVTERFRLWRQRRRWMGEMANAAALGRFDDILNDVGITRAELGVMIDAPADAGMQFETFADAAQIDLRHRSPAVLREAMWVCTFCECAEPCKHWLRTGVWRDGADMRCPNAALYRH